ncbi:FecCD family ABC transporter permease [Corynebacterium kroppenstedtii]|uniref:FecCD family ABC transporter permease n=1 Tax=Corynebacterium sp. PCR 32 TaxID=3351342 RepID=UPI0030A79D59
MIKRSRAVVSHRRRVLTTAIFFPTIIVLLGVSLVYSAAAGQMETTPSQVVGSLLHSMGLSWLDAPSHANAEAALWYVRFPRIVVGAIVGAGLGIAGVLLQGVFSNPLAEPGIIGVSSGAAVGASAAIALGASASTSYQGCGPWMVAVAAFIAGLCTTGFIYLASRRHGRSEVVTLILTGVATNAMAGGMISFLTFIASTAARDQIVFWQMGSIAGASWTAAGIIGVVTIPVSLFVWIFATPLDLLSLGEVQARHLGVNVERLRGGVVVVVSLIVAVGVAFTGIISFVGLVVPHALRLIVGPGHRVLIPASALGGALTLTVADVIARTAIQGADLPLGMLTALIGGPVFFYLLRRSRGQSGAWR